MPQVPIITQNVESRGIGAPSISARAQETRTQLPQKPVNNAMNTAIAQFGEGLQQGGLAIAVDAKRAADEIATQDAETALGYKQLTIKENLAKMKGKDAVTSAETAGQQYDDAYVEIAQGLKTDDQREYFNKIYKSSRLRFMETAQSYQRQQMESYADDSAKAAIEMNAYTAEQNFDNDEQVSANEKAMNDAIIMRGTRRGDAQNVIANDLRKAGNNFWSGIMAKKAGTDPEQFLGEDGARPQGWDGLSGDQQEHVKNLAEKEVKRREEVATNAFLTESVNNALAGNGTIDPKSKGAQKVVDTWWNNEGANLPKEAQVEAVAHLGVMPSQLESTMRASMAGGDVGQVVKASEFISAVNARNPLALPDLDSSSKARAEKVSSLISGGVDPARAVDWATKESTQKGTPEREYREKQFSDKKQGIGDFSKVAGKFNPELPVLGMFSRDPEVPDGLKGEYTSLVKGYYLNEGLTAEQAQQLALKDIQRSWDISEISGNRRWMQYAPEAVYKVPGADPSWIKEQLHHDIARDYMFDHEGNSIENLFVAPNPQTTAGKEPRYYVYKRDNSGRLEPLISREGKILEWKPTWNKSPEYKRLNDELQDKRATELQKAKDRRQSAIDGPASISRSRMNMPEIR